MFAQIAAAKKLQRQQHLQNSSVLKTQNKLNSKQLITQAYRDIVQPLSIDDLSDNSMRFIRILLSEAKYQCVLLLMNRREFKDTYIAHCKSCYNIKYGSIPIAIDIPDIVYDVNTFEFQLLRKLYGFSNDNLSDLNELLADNYVRNHYDEFKKILSHPAFDLDYLPTKFYQFGSIEYISILLDRFPDMAVKVEFNPYNLSLEELENLLQYGCSAQNALDQLFPNPENDSDDLECFPFYLKLCMKYGANFSIAFYDNIVYSIDLNIRYYEEDFEEAIFNVFAELFDRGCNLFLKHNNEISYIERLMNIEGFDPAWVKCFIEKRNNWSYSNRQLESEEETIIIDYIFDDDHAKEKYGDATILDTYIHMLPYELKELIILRFFETPR